MAHVLFGPGTLSDYYNGSVTRCAFIGFPLADFNDFDSGIYVSPAQGPTGITDLVRWYWRVKSWSVHFFQNDSTAIFNSQSSNELELIQNGAQWSDGLGSSFGIGIVINDLGYYGIQTDLNNADEDRGESIFNLHEADVAGDKIVFYDGSGAGSRAEASPDTFWEYA